jgi:hypothetical protein
VYGAGTFTKQLDGVIYGSDASSTLDVTDTDSSYQFNADVAVVSLDIAIAKNTNFI